MSNNFYNKLKEIYNSNKNKIGNHLLYKSSSSKGEEINCFNKNNRSLPAITKNKKSKIIIIIFM